MDILTKGRKTFFSLGESVASNINLPVEFQYNSLYKEHKEEFLRSDITYKRFNVLAAQASRIQGLVSCQPETLLAAIISLFLEWRRLTAKHRLDQSLLTAKPSDQRESTLGNGASNECVGLLSLASKSSRAMTMAKLADIFSISSSTLLKARLKVRSVAALDPSLRNMLQSTINEAETAVGEINKQLFPDSRGAHKTLARLHKQQ